MTELTREQIAAWLKAAHAESGRRCFEHCGLPGCECDEASEAKTAAEVALISNREALACQLLTAIDRLADADMAQAALVERAAEAGAEGALSVVRMCRPEPTITLERIAEQEVRSRIRALAPDAGVKALAELRAERDAALAETDAFRMCVACGLVVPASHDRAEPGPGCKAPEACTFDLTPSEAWQHWRMKEHKTRADRDILAAKLAEAEAQVAALREALEDIAKQKTTEEITATEDIGMCDFEAGYDAIIGVARAALADPPNVSAGWPLDEGDGSIVVGKIAATAAEEEKGK